MKIALMARMLVVTLPAIFPIVPAVARGGHSARSGGDVSVRGYYRGGTYVRPYMRSAADSDFGNNWSTYGNVNPYTGEEGTKNRPLSNYGYGSIYGSYGGGFGFGSGDGTGVRLPSGYNPAPNSPESGFSSPDVFPGDDQNRIEQAEVLKQLGVNVDWHKYAWCDMVAWEARIRKALDLKRLGTEVDWRQHTWNEMAEMEFEIQRMKGSTAVSQGRSDCEDRQQPVSPSIQSPTEEGVATHPSYGPKPSSPESGFSSPAIQPGDDQLRIEEAKALKRLGVEVDWQKYTWADMREWERRASKANDLKRLGVETDWREHSWAEMYDIESRLEKANDLKRVGVLVDWHDYTLDQLLAMESTARLK